MKRQDGDTPKVAATDDSSDSNPKPFNLFKGVKEEPLQSSQKIESPSLAKVENISALPLVKSNPNRKILYVGIATLIIGLILGVWLAN